MDEFIPTWRKYKGTTTEQAAMMRQQTAET